MRENFKNFLKNLILSKKQIYIDRVPFKRTILIRGKDNKKLNKLECRNILNQ